MTQRMMIAKRDRSPLNLQSEKSTSFHLRRSPKPNAIGLAAIAGGASIALDGAI